MSLSDTAEASVVRNHSTGCWCRGKHAARSAKNLSTAQDTLDADHYGLEKVKERILEYLAVQSRVAKMKGPILCLVGPPGVGKTSQESIVAANNQNSCVWRWAACAR